MFQVHCIQAHLLLCSLVPNRHEWFYSVACGLRITVLEHHSGDSLRHKMKVLSSRQDLELLVLGAWGNYQSGVTEFVR